MYVVLLVELLPVAPDLGFFYISSRCYGSNCWTSGNEWDFNDECLQTCRILKNSCTWPKNSLVNLMTWWFKKKDFKDSFLTPCFIIGKTMVLRLILWTSLKNVCSIQWGTSFLILLACAKKIHSTFYKCTCMEKKEEEAALTSFRSLEVHVFQFFTLVNCSNIESFLVGKDISWG